MISGDRSSIAAMGVSRETLERLAEYAALVKKWNGRINLVSRTSMDEIWTRHIADSAQLLVHAPEDLSHWADLGSGGGFPGVVVAVLLSEMYPHAAVTLVESDQRKSAFLRTACRHLELSATVRTDRIESLAPLAASVVSARALAPLSVLLGFATRHLAPGGRALFLKGAGAQRELNEALKDWQFDCQQHQSNTNNEASILKIGAIERARSDPT